MGIEEYLPIGHANAISGETLAENMDISLRELREIVSIARRDIVILNMQDGKGYFIPSDDEQALVERWLKQEESRLKRHAMSLKACRRKVRSYAG